MISMDQQLDVCVMLLLYCCDVMPWNSLYNNSFMQILCKPIMILMLIRPHFPKKDRINSGSIVVLNSTSRILLNNFLNCKQSGLQIRKEKKLKKLAVACW